MYNNMFFSFLQNFMEMYTESIVVLCECGMLNYKNRNIRILNGVSLVIWECQCLYVGIYR